MIILIAIISCLTLIILSVGFFLQLKSNRNTLATIINFEESTTTKAEFNKNEIFLKIQETSTSTQAIMNVIRSELQKTIKENLTFVHEDLITKLKESDINNYKAIESAKKDLLESFETKINQLKSETQPLLTSFKNESNELFNTLSKEINLKVEAALHFQQQNQTELIEEVKNKFGKIIDEIKSPLTID